MTIKPLAGIRVISMAHQYPGPYATMLMADLGADVIIVENPDGGDPARRDPAFFDAVNRNKRSVVLDLKTGDGRSKALELVRDADIFLEGFKPGTVERLGMSYETIVKINPDIIYVSISAYGQTGPYRDRPAHDISIQAMGGMLAGKEESALHPPYFGHADVVAGVYAAFGAVAALNGRATGGSGVHIDVSMADCMVSWMMAIVGPVMNGAATNEPSFPGYGLFRCADGRWLSVSVMQEAGLWRSLAEAVGRPDLREIPADARQARRAELDGLLQDIFSTRDRDTWAVVLDRHNVAWAPVNTPDEVAADPHFRAREMFARIEREHGFRGYVAQPLKFEGMALSPERPSPELGEHNEEIFGTGRT